MQAQFQLSETVALLKQFPGTLAALLGGLPEGLTSSNEGEKTWSAFDTVGHLCHLERSHWMQRVRSVLEHGESQPFAAVDRWAQSRESVGKTLAQLLAEFAELRAANLRELTALQVGAEQLVRRGMHPAFGPVTLENVLATWASHDLTHLHQLSRALAHQFRVAVGPWQKYLGVLHCNGHSEG